MEIGEYSMPIQTYVNFSLNFNEIYNYIKNEFPDLDDFDIECEFGDHIDDYIVKFATPKVNEEQLENAWNEEYFDDFLNHICDDFGRFLDNNYKKL